MLIRVFRGVIREGAHETLVRELHDDVLPRIEAHPDVAYVSLGLPWDASPNEYLLETHWATKQAMVASIGEDWQTPTVDEFERHLLVSVFAHHYLTRSAPTRKATNPRPEATVILLGPIRIDGLRRRVSWDGSSTCLPPREMAALIALAAHPGAPVASGDLARRIWPGSAVVTAYDVRRVVYQLRGALLAGRIPLAVRNVHGSGYCLDLPPSA